MPSGGARPAASGDRGRPRLPAPARRRRACRSWSTRSASSGCGATTGWEARVADARGGRRRGRRGGRRQPRRCGGPSGDGRPPSRSPSAPGPSWCRCRRRIEELGRQVERARARRRGRSAELDGRCEPRSADARWPPATPTTGPRRPGLGWPASRTSATSRQRRRRPPRRSATPCSPTGPSAAASTSPAPR